MGLFRVSTDSIPAFRDAICSLDVQVKDLAAQARSEVLWEETPERVTKMTSLRSDIGDLKRQVLKLTDRQHEIQGSVDNLPDLRDAIGSLEARVSAMSTQAPTKVSWEAVSERVASEVSRTSEEWIN